MKPSVQILPIDGPAGTIETKVESPPEPSGVALICHPHPLFGGTNDNKVVHTLASTFIRLGYAALRPNFRGVGASAGVHDDGHGETEDMLAVLDESRRIFGELPVVLAGFSFGAYVQTRVAESLADSGQPAQRLVLVGTAAGAFLSALLRGGLRVEHVPAVWAERFGPSVARRFAWAFIGGAVIMFASRLANGCTSGNGISQSLQLAVVGWTFFATMFASGVATAWLMFRGR